MLLTSALFSAATVLVDLSERRCVCLCLLVLSVSCLSTAPVRSRSPFAPHLSVASANADPARTSPLRAQVHVRHVFSDERDAVRGCAGRDHQRHICIRTQSDAVSIILIAVSVTVGVVVDDGCG